MEQKWQERWERDRIYDVGERDSARDKEYVLVELPYPSGNLHIGHWHAFAVPDIYVRYRRMTGVQAIYPMGFDAFGLPAENAAIKRNINPREWTESNIAHMKTQLKSMGNAFSWDKTASTIDPDYYRWTQWMFTQFFANDIAYRGKGTVNWCPGCNTVIANEQVQSDGTCERCDSTVERKEMPQWMLRITNYADRLIDDLEELDWPEHIKDAQRNWIGRSEGAEIDFTLSTGDAVTVFTTRPDTLFGATYLVLAPEHSLLQTTHVRDLVSNLEAVDAYAAAAKRKAEQDRLDGSKEKTGVRLEGITATNPANGEDIPVFIADYVLASYGTGAIMAVPAHDERDFAFAQKFSIPIKPVVVRHYDLGTKDGVETLERGDVVDLIIEHPTDGTFLLQRESADDEPDHVHFVGGGTDGEAHDIAIQRELLEETGFSDYEIIAGPVDICTALAYRHTKSKNQKTKSHFYHIKLKNLTQGTSEIDDGKHTVEWVQKEEVGSKITWTAHKDAWECFMHGKVYTGSGILSHSGEFSGMDSEAAKEAITKKVGGRLTNTYRLRDWSIGRQRYWGVPIPIVYDPDGKAHPVPEEHLPWTLPEDVDYTPTGEAPLAKSQELKERTEKLFGEGWTPEVETMDTFVDSSWYFLRYIDNQCDTAPASLTAQADWLPVDLYFGGAEHTTMHVLYSRFWQKALYDLNLASAAEPYTRRINRGLILGPDGNKMSKSKGNVIDPDEQVAHVGADSVKMYLAFMGPYGEVANYPWDMGGLAGTRRFLERVNGLSEHITESEDEDTKKLLHKTITKLKSDIVEFKFNTAISAMMEFVNYAEKHSLSQASYEQLLRLLAPFAPHLTEELWEQAGHKTSIHQETYPEADPDLLVETVVTIGVQVQGKHRGSISIAPDATEADAVTAALAEPQVQKWVEGEPKKVIYVPGKILNLIV